MQISMEIAQADDVETERFHGREILLGCVEGTRRTNALRESQVKVIHHRLVTRDGLNRSPSYEATDSRAASAVSGLT